MDMTDTILHAENISKAFIGVQALDNVSVEIKKGSIHCLAGENGSGKSTFVKTIAGVYQPDAGNIILNGKRYGKLTPTQAMNEGIQVIYQDLSLFSHMTVAENIALGCLRQKGKRYINWNEIYKIAKEQIEKISIDIDLNSTVMENSMANKQLTAICRALSQDAKILFMDEPTSALSKQEVENLLKVVNELKERGLAIVFISHKLDEIFKISDEITIFRDGKKCGDFNSNELDQKTLAYHMTGRDVTYPKYIRKYRDNTPLLDVKNLTKKRNYEDISFTVRKGDIFGITGLLGSGRTELALSLFGLNSPTGGQILFNGKTIRIHSPSVAQQAGIALLPEDRATQGLFQQSSIKENVSATMLKEISNGIRIINSKQEKELAETSVEKLKVHTPSIETTIDTLSGGNQQKNVVAKWLNTAPMLFIMDSPTVGIDIGSKAEIYELIQSFADEGMAIILITDELEELMTNCNRVMIMAHYKKVAELDEEDLAKDNAEHVISDYISAAIS